MRMYSHLGAYTLMSMRDDQRRFVMPWNAAAQGRLSPHIPAALATFGLIIATAVAGGQDGKAVQVLVSNLVVPRRGSGRGKEVLP
jgi:hypothetical protein